MSTNPPAWHPDPFGRFESRYWDGGRWTEHVSDGGATAVDPTEWRATTSSEATASPPPLPEEAAAEVPPEPDPAPAPPAAPGWEPTPPAPPEPPPAATPPPSWPGPSSNVPPTPPAWGRPGSGSAWSAAAGRGPVGTRDRVPAIVGLAAAVVLLVSAFLPWFRVSVEFAGLEASETVSGIDGSDGFVIIVLALIAGALALLRVLGKGVPQVGIGMAVVGLLATVVGLIDLGNDDPDTDTPLAGLAEVDPSVGLWLVILAGIVVAVAGVLVVLSGRSRPSPA
jgi:Tryptophan-associated transmembrane protein (Trp_oprn_chp)/Family of unknown function (DUF5336)/Protein of unknown function (DUF2510)